MSNSTTTVKEARKLAEEEAFHRAVYLQLAKSEKNQELREHFTKLATLDGEHSKVWSSLSGERQIKFSNIKVAFYLSIRYLFGSVFAVKLLERGEHKNILEYREKLNRDSNLVKQKSALKEVINDEFDNEPKVVEIIKKGTSNYIAPVVLGLNDALVELIGVIAGLVSAISNNLFIGFSGLVVGIASALSMAASYYLSSDFSEGNRLKSIKGGLYTGASYLLTSLLLVAPFFLSNNRFVALTFSLSFAVSATCLVAFYSAVINDQPFRRNLAKLLILGMGAAILVYFISNALSSLFGIKL